MKQRVHTVQYIGKDKQLHSVRLCLDHELRLRERHTITTVFPDRVGHCQWCDANKDIHLEDNYAERISSTTS